MITRTNPPSGCQTFEWCGNAVAEHTEHMSPAVQAPDVDGLVLYVETDPDTGQTVYGPVLSGESERPVGQARVIAARLRVAAARLDELAEWAEAS